MGRLDRELQLKILNQLAEVYPTGNITYSSKSDNEVISHPDFLANMAYLKAHHFVEYEGLKIGINNDFLIPYAEITNEGLDFIQDDGGISAIKRTISIRTADVENFLDLLKKQAENLPEPQKKTLLKAVKDFSVPIVQRAIGSALSNLFG